MSNNYIEEIFSTLENLKSTDREEIEKVLNLLAENLSQPIIDVLKDENRIIWSDNDNSLIYGPLNKQFVYCHRNGQANSLSKLSETTFWNCADEIIKWIISLKEKLNIIRENRFQTLINFQNMKSLMIQCEKENKFDMGLGFFKNDDRDN